jgi:serine/threonine protein kinase
VAGVNGGRGDLSAGNTLGDFRILSQLGRGGMGVVYLARDERLDRRVALKVIAPTLAADPEFRERFIVEARSAAAIEHPNAVPVYSAGMAGEDLYMAMRYIDGTDLRTALAEKKPLEPQVATRIVSEIATALDAAHAAGMVHRDVKPANILLESAPGDGSSYLTDFGLTKGASGSGGPLTGTGQWVGTIDYVAPEQIQSGVVDARTDVYALGCVLYETLTGTVPYQGNDMQKMWGHVNEPFPTLESQLPETGGSLAGVVARATAKDPDDRFPSAGDLAKAAIAALSGNPVDGPEHSVATGSAATGLTQTAAARPRQGPGGMAPTVASNRPSQAPDPPTARMASPRRNEGGSAIRTAGILGGAVVIAAGLVAAAVIVAGGGSGGSTTVSAKPTSAGKKQKLGESTQSAQSATLPSNLVPCGSAVYVEERQPGQHYTSCEFAREVERSFYESGESAAITAYSPVTGKLYSLTCSGADPVLCTDGESARVYLTPTAASEDSASVPSPSPVEGSASTSSVDLGDWPGGSGYTAMLGAFSSEWRARNAQDEALERGLEAGVLYSSNFSSLRPGYWVAFSGDFANSAEAAAQAHSARSLGYSDSYPRLVSP